MSSRTNTLFSIPMLFFMGAAQHLAIPMAEGKVAIYWIATVIIIGAVEANFLLKPGQPTQKPLTSVKGTIAAGFGLTAVLYVCVTLLPS